MSFKVLDGNFGKGFGHFSNGLFQLPKHSGWGLQSVKVRDVVDIEVATEANLKKVGGTLGWGAAGAVALGPLGLLAGVLLGGRKTEVTFIVTFSDGRAFIATGDQKEYISIRSAALTPMSQNRIAAARKATEAAKPWVAPEPERPPLNSDPATFIAWAFETGGWEYERLPKSGHERHVLFYGTRGRREVVLAQTDDAVTDYSLSQMKGAMDKISTSAEKIIVQKSIGSSVERTAKMLNVAVAGLLDLKVALVR